MITRARRLRYDPRLPLTPRELAPLLERIAQACSTTSDAFDLELADDTRLAALNREHMGCKGPTNILSFPADSSDSSSDVPEDSLDALLPDEANAFLGDLVLSVETLEREAFLYGQDPLEHTVRLITHGLLHLMGMDHGPEMEAMTEAAMDAVLLD